MAIAVGVVLAICVLSFASITKLDRDRAFYPTVMIVIALYYALFAAMGGSAETLALEAVPIAAFVVVSVAGFKYSLWLVAIALVAHGIFDLAHDQLFLNPGVPSWWPPFCSTVDIIFGFYLGWLLQTSRRLAYAAV